MTKTILKSLIIILILVLVESCCKNNYVYVKPLPYKIDTINPKQTRKRIDFMVARAIFGQLIEQNEYGELLPSIFKSWIVSENGASYIFELRDNVFFHSGKKVSSDDVIFSLNYLASKDSLISRYFSNIEGYNDYVDGKSNYIHGISKINKKSLRINLKNTSYIFLEMLADPKVVLLPNNLNGQNEEDFFKNPDGAGSYILKTISNDRAHLVLERFEKYFNKKSNIKTYEFILMDKETAVSQFIAKKIDDIEVYPITKEESEKFKNTANIFSLSSFSTNLLFFNGRKTIFKNIKIREAFFNAIDTNVLSENCQLSILPSNGIIPYGFMGWNKTKSRKEVEPSSILKIGALLKTVHIVSYDDSIPLCIMDNIKKMIQDKLKIKVVTEYKENKDIYDTFFNGYYDLWFDNLSVRGKEPYNFFTFFDPASPHNLTWFKDNKVTTYLDEITNSKANIRTLEYNKLNNEPIAKLIA